MVFGPLRTESFTLKCSKVSGEKLRRIRRFDSVTDTRIFRVHLLLFPLTTERRRALPEVRIHLNKNYATESEYSKSNMFVNEWLENIYLS